MENKKGNQVMAIAALFIAVIGLSLGFAAFSNTLTIRSSADVHPDVSKFDINFRPTDSTDSPASSSYSISGETHPAGGESDLELSGLAADAADVTNDAIVSGTAGTSRIANLRAHFTKPGQSVTYTFEVSNDGEYDAFLRSVVFASPQITCTVATTDDHGTKATTDDTSINTDARATQRLVDAACNKMRIAVTVGGTTYTTNYSKGSGTTYSLVNGSNTTISGHSLLRGADEPIVVTIAYDTEDTGENARPDGVMDVAFGDITLTYSSVDYNAQP